LAGSTERPAAFTGRDLTRKGGRRLRPPFAPMEALSVDEIPTGSGWQYEPKWDGFRCLLFRNGRNVVLQSKSGRSLTRYFPDLGGPCSQGRHLCRRRRDCGAEERHILGRRLAPTHPSGVEPGIKASGGDTGAVDRLRSADQDTWSKFDTTIFPDTAFGTERNSCAGGPTSRRGSAPWIRSCKRKQT
jgi:hypothetical protein